MKPVTPEVVLTRVNSIIEPQGKSLRQVGDGEFIVVDKETGGTILSKVCLDSVASNHNVLSDDEFLCWPEEAGKGVL